MLPLFILGIALMAGLLLAGQWFVNAEPKTLVRGLKWLLLGIILTIVAFFAATGRLGLAFASLPALVPWLVRIRVVHQIYRALMGWRQQQGKQQSWPQGQARGSMTIVEALDILGLEAGASKQEIKAAHHRLISNMHPDHGGSTYLAAQINQAKDVLLG